VIGRLAFAFDLGEAATGRGDWHRPRHGDAGVERRHLQRECAVVPLDVVRAFGVAVHLLHGERAAIGVEAPHAVGQPAADGYGSAEGSAEVEEVADCADSRVVHPAILDRCRGR